jgi:hypothetical protein
VKQEFQLNAYEALALKKALQSQLTQLISLRNSTFEYPADEKPEFNFEDVTNRIKEKVNEITALKVAIMKANMATRLPNSLSLYEAIIELANTRSAIDQLQDLMQVGRRGLWLSDRRRSTTEIRNAKQMPPDQILAMTERYDAKRRALDALIQAANHSVSIEMPVKKQS